MEAAQLKAQENKPEDSKALAELLNKQKVEQFTSSLEDTFMDVHIHIKRMSFSGPCCGD